MAIKGFCGKLMAITDGPSLMDHHRHVWLVLIATKSIHHYHLELYI